MLSPQEIAPAIETLRAAYAAFNRGDIDAAVVSLDPDVEWVEPAEFPGGGSRHGVEGVKRYLRQSRASAAQVISQPEQFLPAGDRIVVFVHAGVCSRSGRPAMGRSRRSASGIAHGRRHASFAFENSRAKLAVV